MNPVQKAVWYVESHSGEHPSLEDVAQACKTSPYHLTRAFAAATGGSLMKYVRGRRLSEAAKRLSEGADDILSLALDSGYSSHEAFTRAFRDLLGRTPGQVRALGHVNDLPLVEALAMHENTEAVVTPDRFETREPFRLAGLVERYACHAKQGIPAQWQRLGPHLGRIAGQVGRTAYGAVFHFDREGNFDYLAGVEVQGDRELPPGFQTLLIPRQKYVVFRHAGHIAGIGGVFSSIWNQWLPGSGFQAADAPTLEQYGPEFHPTTGLGGFEIWIPLEE